MGIGLVILVGASILMAIAIGSVKLFHFHASHLASVLHRKETKLESVGREEPKTESSNTENSPSAKEKPPIKLIPPGKKQEPSLIIQTGPVYGNLKGRLIGLALEILDDLCTHGWRSLDIKMKTQCRDSVFGELEVVPNSWEQREIWTHARSHFFIYRFLPRVIKIRDECAELHFKNERLDESLNAIKGSERIRVMTNRELPILPQAIEDISAQLQVLAEQIK